MASQNHVFNSPSHQIISYLPANRYFDDYFSTGTRKTDNLRISERRILNVRNLKSVVQLSSINDMCLSLVKLSR